MKIKTDYNHVKELYLVYPKDVMEESKYDPTDYSHLTPFYENLINLIPSEIKLKLYVKSRAIANEVRGLRENMELMVNSQLTSIWIRDWSGFSTGEKLYKPIFKPKYYWGEMKLADEINQAAFSLHSFMGIDLEKLPLILDGGNFVTNGKVAIITKRIITDNKKLKMDKQSIDAIIQDKLKVSPIFIDEMEDEKTGHADGCFAFLSENDIAVSKYPETWSEKDRKYLNTHAKMLEDEGYKVHRIDDDPVDKEFSAEGLFVNFLRLNDTILMPEYSHVDQNKTEKNAKALRQFGDVVTINCDELAKLGGVLRCISFTN